MLAASEPPGRLRQRDDAAGGGEGRMPHGGGSHGISCARDSGRQAPFSACGLLRVVCEWLRVLGDVPPGAPMGGKPCVGKPLGLTTAAGGMVMECRKI